MKIQLVTLIDGTLSLDEEALFINAPEAAEAHFDTLLGVLGYQGDTGDESAVQEFMRNQENSRAVIYDFSVPIWLSVETIETLQALERWARQYSPPDFTRLVKAIEEVKAAL